MNNNITEDYVSFEVAKLLKEKGFEWRSPSLIKKEDGRIGFDNINGVPQSMDNAYNCYEENGKPIRPRKYTRTNSHYPRPTHTLAIKWIRLNFGIHISAACYYNPQRLDKIMYEAEISHEGNGYEGLLKNASNRLSVDWTKEPEKYWIFNTPEEAIEAALLYALNNLICN